MVYISTKIMGSWALAFLPASVNGKQIAIAVSSMDMLSLFVMDSEQEDSD